MSDFRAFDTFEEMIEFMQTNEEAANEHLADAQKAVTYDGYWCRFYDIADRVVIFGHVTPLAYWDEKVTQAKPGEDREEWEFEKQQIEDSHRRGYMYGWCYSIVEAEGEPGSTHQANLWPIDKALFDEAKSVGWNIDALGPRGQAALQSVYSAWRAHMLGMDVGR